MRLDFHGKDLKRGAIRLVVGYVAALFLTPFVAICMLALLVSVIAVGDGIPVFKGPMKHLEDTLAVWGGFKPGQSLITSWELFALAALALEILAPLVKRVLPISFPDSYGGRLRRNSLILGGFLALPVLLHVLLPVRWANDPNSKDPHGLGLLLLPLVVYVVAWVSMAIGMAILKIGDRIADAVGEE